MKAITLKTILVVDDQKDLLDLVKEFLEERGYEVATATNGEIALDYIAKVGCPSLILLDMNMPVMDGWKFAHLFNDRYGRSSPIVIMTAEDDSRTRAMEIGADSYIGKPFDLDSLGRVVESMVEI